MLKLYPLARMLNCVRKSLEDSEADEGCYSRDSSEGSIGGWCEVRLVGMKTVTVVTLFNPRTTQTETD